MTIPAVAEAAEPYEFHPTILREYDIRGTMGVTLSEEDAYNLGRAYAVMLQQTFRLDHPVVCVGMDGRISSPGLEQALSEGLSDSGIHVKRIGLGPTPMLYFAVWEEGADGGIMVTGSHNPPDQNGFKMMLGKAALHGDDIRRLGEIAATGEYIHGSGKIEDVNIKTRYVEKLIRTYVSKKPLKVAWDAGHGAAGEVVDMVIPDLPGEHFTLFTRIDGKFPAHHPDPTVEANLQDLIQAVKENGCDVGVAFDGDGDRLGVVDNEGNIIWGDQLMVILAEDMLKKHPGATIIADVKASQSFFDEVERMGGKPVMWKTGHSLVKAKMKELGAPLAGEMSGHIFYADDYYGFDDGVYTAIRLLDIIARLPGTLSERRAQLPQMVNTPEIRFECPEERKFEIIEEIKARLTSAGEEFSDVDGIRMQMPEGWWLLRASNTQAALVARAEASSEKALDELYTSLQGHLAQSGVELPDNATGGGMGH